METRVHIRSQKMGSSGYYHSLFLGESGSVWSCGANTSGQLATGDTIGSNVVQKIIELPPIIATAAGLHSLFLDAQGSVWSCGGNAYGQLGSGNRTNRSKAETSKNHIHPCQLPFFIFLGC